MQPAKAKISKLVPIQRWALGAIVVLGTLISGQAHAVAPNFPTLTCSDNPSIFNTGINGNTSDNSSYNNSTPQMTTGMKDQH